MTRKYSFFRHSGDWGGRGESGGGGAAHQKDYVMFLLFSSECHVMSCSKSAIKVLGMEK